jgi:hypothetical protein
MADTHSDQQTSVAHLILVPALLTLGVTILRLVGELVHGPKMLFAPGPGGPWGIIGITWLAPLFGIYFAVKLVRSGSGPTSLWRTLGVALVGSALILASNTWGGRIVAGYGFKAVLIFFWTVWLIAGLVQCLGWPRFFRVLLAYAYAARVPVAVVMFFAFWGRWGTHYDALPPGWESQGLWSDFFWLGFFPQMMLWAGYTITAGALFGSITAGLMRLFRPSPKPAAA